MDAGTLTEAAAKAHFSPQGTIDGRVPPHQVVETFDRCYPAARKRNLRAFHTSELPYVFGRVGPGAPLPPNWPRPDGANEQRLSAVMINHWTSFARTGTPAGAALPRWPAFGREHFFMRLASGAIVARDPLPGMFAMQEALVGRRRAANRQWFLNVGVAAPAARR